MVNDEEVRAVAQAFAEALDRNDFERVAPLLSPTCRYDLTGSSFTSEEILVGPEAILESYRWHDARARRLFDRVEYSSVVESVDGKTMALASLVVAAISRHVLAGALMTFLAVSAIRLRARW